MKAKIQGFASKKMYIWQMQAQTLKYIYLETVEVKFSIKDLLHYKNILHVNLGLFKKINK